MKIVIDIDNRLYNRIKYLEPKADTMLDELMRSIQNGTPLPEHHGRLIDADEFQRYCFNKNFDRRLSEGGLATINMFLELQPTIIEADRGSGNE